MANVLGLLTLLAIAAGVVCLLAAWGLAHALRHPPRKTYAVALGRGDPTEPEQVDLAGDPTTFRLADGSASPGWFIRGERAGLGEADGDGDGPGAVLIVSHGFGDSRYGALSWAKLFVPFAAELVVFDHRGHGEAEGTATIAGRREAEDLAAVIDQALARQGERAEHARQTQIASGLAPASAAGSPAPSDTGASVAVPPVVLFGYSRGATIAVAAAARDRRVAGVIADGPYRRWHEPVRQTMRQRRYPSEPMLALVRGGLWLIGGGAAAVDYADDAGKMECPLLVLHGNDDPYCSLEAARGIAEAASDGELVAFEGAGHLDLAQRDPQRYRDALARFFARLTAR